MILDRSIDLFLQDSFGHELYVESGALRARKRAETAETTQSISQAVFSDLVARGAVDARAKQVVDKMRVWQIHRTPQTEGFLGAISSFFSSVFTRTPALELSLNDWVEEKVGTPEYSSRVKAARLIRASFDTSQKRLNLSNLQLTSLPAVVCELTHLTSLNVSDNQLKTLPLNFGRLSALTCLDCHLNEFEAIPDIIFSLLKLEDVDFSENGLTGIPSRIGSLINLQIFNASFNRITEIPKEIASARKLRHLFLKNNLLSTLPSELFNLPLTYLHLGRNRLEAIPAGIRRLQLLKRLDINHNRLTALPDEICELARLIVFNAHNNLLASFPRGMYRLINMETFNFHDNPLTEEPIFSLAPPREEAVTLAGGLNFWLGQKRALVDHLPATTFDLSADYPNLSAHPQKDLIGGFLYRVREMKDFRVESQKPIIALAVYSAIQLAETNPEFLEKLMSIAEDVSTSCGDGITLGFNDLMISHQIFSQTSSPINLSKILVGAARKILLDEEAATIAATLGRASESREIALYLQVRCKAALKLPILNNDMLYTDVGRIDGTKVAEIEARVYDATKTKDQVVTVLKDSSFWCEFIKKQNPAAIEAIVTRNSERLDALMERGDLTQSGFLAETGKIQDDQKKETMDFILAQTEIFVLENLSEII